MRQLTAIMFTDIVGFTALMQEDEAHARAVVRQHRDAVSRSIDAHEGELLQFYGDGTLGVFKSTVRAIECAIDVQARMRGPDGTPLRVGLHMGDVVHEGGGVFGDGINVASRIQGISVPGAVLVSGKVADEVKNHTHIETRRLGAFSFKNVKEPIWISAVVGHGLAVPSFDELPKRAGSHRGSVAVLPFVNMSSDAENEFFADGITEEVINVLTRVEGLKVTARTSSFAFKGHHQDVRDIGQRLQVDTVLEGSVRKAGSHVRVTAQLIDTTDGYHLFSESYDRDLEDIFATQDEIASAIVRQLQANIDSAPELPAGLVLNETRNGAAYLEYLKGLHHWNRRTLEDQRKAVAYFQEATRLEPDWAPPHALLAGCHVVRAKTGVLPQQEEYRAAEASARSAVRVGRGVALAHVAQGMVHLHYHWDFESAQESFRTALALSPGLSEARRTYGTALIMRGDFEGGIRELEAAVELDPLSPLNLAHLARAHSLAHRFDDALAEVDRALALDPSFRPAIEISGQVRTRMGRLQEAIAAFESLPSLAHDHFEGAGGRGHVYALAGRTEDASAMLGLLAERELQTPGVVPHYELALIHAGLRNDDIAVACLQRAVEERMSSALWIPVSPEWFPLRTHPEFQELLETVAHPDPGTSSSWHP
jgi:TolB-like protein/Flp pilus assembly protein TadD